MSFVTGKKLALAALSACTAVLAAVAVSVPAQAAPSAAAVDWNLDVIAAPSNNLIRYADVEVNGKDLKCFRIDAGQKRTAHMHTALPVTVKVTGYDDRRQGLPACFWALGFAGQSATFKEVTPVDRSVTLSVGRATVDSGQ